MGFEPCTLLVTTIPDLDKDRWVAIVNDTLAPSQYREVESFRINLNERWRLHHLLAFTEYAIECPHLDLRHGIKRNLIASNHDMVTALEIGGKRGMTIEISKRKRDYFNKILHIIQRCVSVYDNSGPFRRLESEA